MNDDDRVPGALSALADFGKSHTRVAEAGIIRRLGAARRRRRQAVVGAAGAATVAGAAAVALVVPEAADSGGYPSLVSGRGIAYRAHIEGFSVDGQGQSGSQSNDTQVLVLLLPDVKGDCAGLPLATEMPRAAMASKAPVDEVVAAKKNCWVNLEVRTGMMTSNGGYNEDPRQQCPLWPPPPHGYVAAQEVANSCPADSGDLHPDGTKPLGWLLVPADGNASYVGVTPIAEPSPTAKVDKILLKSYIDSLKNPAATSSP